MYNILCYKNTDVHVYLTLVAKLHVQIETYLVYLFNVLIFFTVMVVIEFCLNSSVCLSKTKLVYSDDGVLKNSIITECDCKMVLQCVTVSMNSLHDI